jgi:peptidoglycan/xylan/chitin deacetylase (PgdA/CDA1 family)
MKRGLYVGAVRIGRALGLGRHSLRPGSLRVLMYHKVTDARPNSIAVGVDSFAAQQELLGAEYEVVGLATVLDHVRNGAPLPDRAVLLTFDDGYRDNLLNARPILERHGHTAVVFVPTAFVGEHRALPHDARLPTANPTMTWDELNTLAPVFDVGSHGVSHRVLTHLPFEEARAEIFDSKRALEEHLGREVHAFSYPKGSVGDRSPALDAAVREAGYELCFLTIPGVNRPRFDPLAVRRHNVEDYGLDYFRALLDGSAILLGAKDTRAGYHAKSLLNRARGRAA